MALFSSKKQEVTNTTNTTYSPTTISTTVGPTVSESQSSYTSANRTKISDAYNTVGSYNRTFSVNQPTFISGAGSESLMRGMGFDLNSFFSAPKSGTEPTSQAESFPWLKIAIGGAILFFIFKLIRK